VTLKAILWDFDGTLIFFNIDAPRMRREIFEYMTRLGYQPPDDGRWRSIFNIIQDAKEFFLNAGKSAEEVDAFASHVEEIINMIEAEGTGTARVVPGIPEVLQQTHQWGIKHAIITLNRGKNVTQLLTQLGLIQYFDVIAGRDVVMRFKPDPAHTQYILDRLQLNPEDCLMIGDHPNDLATAKAARVPFVAVITNRHPRAEFWGAQFFVQQELMEETLSFIRIKL
jgi:phosphoglycolate phosphatase